MSELKNKQHVYTITELNNQRKTWKIRVEVFSSSSDGSTKNVQNYVDGYGGRLRCAKFVQRWLQIL